MDAVSSSIIKYIDEESCKYGYKNIIDMFDKLDICGELPHFSFHVMEEVMKVTTSDPFAMIFGYTVEGTECQKTLDNFMRVAHDIITEASRKQKEQDEMDLDEWLDYLERTAPSYDDGLEVDLDKWLDYLERTAPSYDDGWEVEMVFGLDDEEVRDLREHLLAKSLKIHHDDNFMRMKLKEKKLEEKKKFGRVFLRYKHKKVSKRSGKKDMYAV